MIIPGRIEIFMGCMFSGKTSELMRQARRLQCISRSVLFINHAIDRRYDVDGRQDQVFSHDGVSFPCLNVSTLAEVQESDLQGIDAVFVNEGQFFCDLVSNVIRWCEHLGKDIYVGGLDGDLRRERFGQMLDLVPLADAVHKLHAFCFRCGDGTLAPFTHRISGGAGQVEVGVENYVALCRRHYCDALVSSAETNADS